MISIRKYQEKDFPYLCIIHDRARKQELKSANLEAAFIPLKIAAKKEGLFRDYQVYVATNEDKVIGFVAFNKGELGWLYVDPAFQHQGVGGKLIDFVLTSPYKPIYLEVLKGNPAKNLYLKKGFKVIGQEKGKMPGNEKFQVEVDLMKY